MNCDYCNTNPGTKENGIVWNGFLDLDTKQNVCFNCKPIHYQQKKETEFKNLVSEYPIIVEEIVIENKNQLELF